MKTLVRKEININETMKGCIIDIGTVFRPNPDGTEEGTISIMSKSNANCFDVLVWKTEPKASRTEAIDEIIKHLETIKEDIDLCIQMQQMMKKHITAE